MTFLWEQGVPVIKLDMIATLALAILLLLFGRVLVNRISILGRFCIPAPVAGGLLFSILMLVLQQSGLLLVKMDTLLQVPFSLAFFTTIGLIASLRLVKQGGKLLIVYWFFCALLSLMQNVIGTSLAQVLGIDPLLGVLMGAVSMEGGHGAAGAFGPEVEAMGVYGATAVAMAAATFGLVSGGLIGGPIAKYLLNKHNLHSSELEAVTVEGAPNSVLETKEEATTEESEYVTNEVSAHSFLLHSGVIAICMSVGLWMASWLKGTLGIALPSYVGAMFFAVILRNLNDQLKVVKLHTPTINLIGDVCLGVFLSMALMTLKLWELVDLAIPMLVVLGAQVLFMILYCLYLVFPMLGRSYDAVIMCAGMAGHGLGATPNAMANMKAVTEKFGPSTKAFLIVPLCGAFLIDLFALPCIVWFINYFAH
ncbi:sodium/glutamate symporter [Veillonella sp. R32]|uniref:sodium/glutamate symporter n=1 Tax=Veillonella sp. R32 TaxID=2021312 RepID=UPI001389A7D5|nr:sodium/glutamate symporter [Veillonella sp. R32]KAF1683810.1 sodium/glutamate symporter [Veillonella sp. R32]